MRQTAAGIADQGIGKGGQFFGDAGAVHDLACQDEKRHGHECEQVQPLEKTLGSHGEKVLPADLHQAGHPGHPQGDTDGQTDQDEEEEQEDDDDHVFTKTRNRAIKGLRPL